MRERRREERGMVVWMECEKSEYVRCWRRGGVSEGCEENLNSAPCVYVRNTCRVNVYTQAAHAYKWRCSSSGFVLVWRGCVWYLFMSRLVRLFIPVVCLVS